LEIKEIKKSAYQAAKHEDISLETGIRGLNAQERLYYLEMLYFYLLFDAGRIKLTEAQKIEQKINSEYSHLDNALRLSQEEYKRIIQRSLNTNIERSKLCKQLLTGDRDFIHTLLHLLDIYTGEGIYNQMYQIMRIPLTDPELDEMIAECPERYFRKMTRDEARQKLWRVVRQLNGDEEVA
jgi:hypothetical protein